MKNLSQYAQRCVDLSNETQEPDTQSGSYYVSARDAGQTWLMLGAKNDAKLWLALRPDSSSESRGFPVPTPAISPQKNIRL